MEKRIIKVVDGVVVIKNCLSIQDQQRLATIVVNYGNLIDADGVPNFSRYRGRNYSNMDVYGNDDKQYMKRVCESVVKDVHSVDPSIPGCDPTHLLSLYYVDKRGIGWHADDGKNDGDMDTPVISFTIGNSCIFEYKIEDKVFSDQLDSGDVIVFGGPQRLMVHRVKKVLRGTAPDSLDLDNVRINLTFRQATSVIGKEDEFSTEKYREEMTEKMKK